MSSNKTLVGLNLAVFSMMLGVGMIMALLPKRIIDITGCGATVGYLASAFALSYIILQVPIGNWSDRIGYKNFLLIGYLLCFITGFIYYFADSANIIFLGRAVQGVGEAPVWALAPKDLANGSLQRQLNLLEPDKIWTWDPNSRRPYKGYTKRQLPMWHKYRVELYPHFNQASGIVDQFGNQLQFPAAFRVLFNFDTL